MSAIEMAFEATMGLTGMMAGKAAISRIFGSLSNEADKASNKFGLLGKVASGSLLAISAGALATVAALGASVSTAASFQQAMAEVASVTGGGAEALATLSEAAKEAGASTVYSASESASAMYYLASAGQTTEQITTSLNSVLSLAAAGQMDLAYASEITTSTLAQFKLGAEESGRVANVLAAAASATNTTIGQLGGAMGYVGPVAASLGYSLEDTTAALGLLANAGLKGERGGTALRGALSALMKPSNDAKAAFEEMGIAAESMDPSMNSLVDIIGTLEAGEMTAAQATRIFGQEAGPSMLALVSQGSKALEVMTERISDTNKAAEMAATQNETFQGSLKMLTSAIESVKISAGSELLPGLTAGVDAATEAVRLLGENMDTLGDAFGNAADKAEGVWDAWTNEGRGMFGEGGALEGKVTFSIDGPMWMNNETGEIISDKEYGQLPVALRFDYSRAEDTESITEELARKTHELANDIKIGEDWFGSVDDLTKARNAGQLTNQAYLQGITDITKSKSQIQGATADILSYFQQATEQGLMKEGAFKSVSEDIASMYEEIGDATTNLTAPMIEAFDSQTIGAEDLQTMIDTLATSVEGLGESADEIIGPFTEAWDGSAEGAVALQGQLDTLQSAITIFGADAESMLSPISEALDNGTLSAEGAESAISSLTTVVSTFGTTAAQNLTAPLTEALESGQLLGEEYTSMMDVFAEGSTKYGTEFARMVGDINAVWTEGGFESIDEYNSAIMEGMDQLATDFPEGVQTIFDETNDLASDAGEADGKSYGEAFSDEVAKSYEYSLSNLVAGGKSRGTLSAGELTVGEDTYSIEHVYGFSNPWRIYKDGELIKSGLGDDLLENYLRSDPELWKLVDENQLEAARLEAISSLSEGELANYGYTSETVIQAATVLRATSDVEILDPYETWGSPQHMADYFAEYADIVDAGGEGLLQRLYRMEESFQTEGAAGWEEAWATLFDPDATDQQISTAIAALDLSDTQKLWVEMLRDTLGDIEAAEVFEELFSEEIPISFSSMISAGLTDFDELFEDVGSQARSAFENGLSEEEAFSIAGMYAEMKDTDAIQFAKMGGEDALAWWEEAQEKLHQYNLVASGIVEGDLTALKADLDAFFGTYKGEVEVTTNLVTPEISAFREAQLWADWGGSDAKRGLGEYSDDLMSLYHEIENATEYQSDLNDAFEMMIDPLSYTNEELAEARNILLQYTDATEDQIDATMRYYASIGDVTEATKKLKNEVTEAGGLPDWMSNFSYFQEEPSNKMFKTSYIGETEGWAGPGLGAKAGYESSNYFQYEVEVGLELNPDEANAKLDTLETDIETQKIAPVDANIDPALSQLATLEAEIMEPVTKPVYIEYIESLGGAGNVSVESSWLDMGVFDSGGIVTSPTIGVFGKMGVPEVAAPLKDLVPIIENAVVAASGSGRGGGGDTFQLIVQGNITEDVWPKVRAEMKQMISDAKTENAENYRGRFRGGP